MKRIFLLPLFLLASCGPPPKDYEAMAKCGNSGLKVGTAEYDACVSQETRNNLIDKHRAEIEKRQQEERQQQQIYRRF